MELMTPLPPPPLGLSLPDADAAAAESPLVAGGGEGSQSALAKPSCEGRVRSSIYRVTHQDSFNILLT